MRYVCCNHNGIRQIDFHYDHVLAVKKDNLSMRTQNMNEFMKNFQKN